MWKPCAELRLADFDAHPVWSHDLSREHEPGSDETFVRPWADPRLEAMAEPVYFRAVLSFAGREVEGGATASRPFLARSLEQARLPELTGLLIFDPYEAVSVIDAAVVPRAETYAPGRFGEGSLVHDGQVRWRRETRASRGLVDAADADRIRSRLGVPLRYHAKFRLGVFAVELSGTIGAA